MTRDHHTQLSIRGGTMRNALFILSLSLLLAACSTAQYGAVRSPAPNPIPGAAPRIVAAAAPLQCVAFARNASGVAIWGNASTWWNSAAGRYRRGNRPAVGSVLVWRRSNRLRLGHLAVVTAVLDSRRIIANHANWLNRGQIHLGTPIVDVSRKNDWSEVRVWYTPGDSWGARSYPAQGFIYPGQVASY